MVCGAVGVHGPVGSFLSKFFSNGCLDMGEYVLIAVALLLCCTARKSTGLGQGFWSSTYVCTAPP